MAKIKAECLAIDDDIRWLVAIIFDLGMRLSEAAGLMIDDLKLEGPLPYINLVPHPHRRLDTAPSERKIPLAGLSLWAAKRLKQYPTGLYYFPRYKTLSDVIQTAHLPQLTNGLGQSEALQSRPNLAIIAADNEPSLLHTLNRNYHDRALRLDSPTLRLRADPGTNSA
jgi:integrase